MLLTTHPEISVNADFGIFVYTNGSGSGKTYLYSIIRKIEPIRKDVLAFSYNDYLKHRKPNLEGKHLIVLDRVDQYVDDIDLLDYFFSCGDRAVILMDLKCKTSLKRVFGFASIHYNEDSLKVYCDTFV